ncbi:hypothetical protein IHV12_04185 [Fictibacillus sp. 7GRE50]|uniref:hypothetical protein n=1 Tax=Fictibacillus sp. 7GRE50 TaxID=2745878 RepID=UPI0018CE4837|nr:hypothetical protein [Fictibacillus sp. 7GRE50]MBH0164099.1 hypothetical protein [Fictibacillus sp. 7GRE50]
MVWIRIIIIYILLVYLWTGILKIFELSLNKYKRWFLKRVYSKQETYLIKNDIIKLVRTIKCEMFIEDKINKITPYFPYRLQQSYSDERLMFEIRKDYEVLFFYVKKLWPFKLINFLFIVLIFYFQTNIFDKLSHILNWKNIKSIGNPLPFIPSTIALILLIVAIYFTSRSGLFRKAKNKVKVEEIENKIKFHKENRIILSSLLYDGYKNIERMILKRKFIISQVNDIKKRTNLSFAWLEDLESIKELDEFISKSEKNNKDLFPFYLGIHHISFIKLDDLYREVFTQNKNRISKLNAVFLTKTHMESIIKNQYFHNNPNEKLNESLIISVKTLIYIEKYLNIINNQINKPHSIYSFFAFITNKDK